MSLHALRTGHHVRIGAAVFLISQRLPEGAWQLQNTVTGEWRTFDENDLLDQFATSKLSFVAAADEGTSSASKLSEKLTRDLSVYPSELIDLAKNRIQYLKQIDRAQPKGPERNFPARCFFFLREDVMKIKGAFERRSVPVKAYSKPGEFIALRHAMKNYLGRSSGLAAVIRAVVDGSLVPVGYTNRFRGITGYLFRSEDLRKYRPVPGMTVHPEVVITYREAAAVLGVAVRVIRGLVAQGIMRAAAESRNGFSKLLPAADVQRFADLYVATSVLARRFRLNSGCFARHLKESGTRLLAIPIPDAGRGHAFFLRKEVAAQIQPPSRKMLKEAAQRRIKAGRKKKWAEYRLARETSSGKPMRRQLL